MRANVALQAAPADGPGAQGAGLLVETVLTRSPDGLGGHVTVAATYAITLLDGSAIEQKQSWPVVGLAPADADVPSQRLVHATGIDPESIASVAVRLDLSSMQGPGVGNDAMAPKLASQPFELRFGRREASDALQLETPRRTR